MQNCSVFFRQTVLGANATIGIQIGVSRNSCDIFLKYEIEPNHISCHQKD